MRKCLDPLYAEPAIPVENHFPEEADAQCRHSQESPERQLIGGRVFAGEPDVSQSDHSPLKASRDQREQSTLYSQECTDHRDHFDVAESQALAVPDFS